MKMHEKLGIDFTTIEGVIEAVTIDCSDIPDEIGMRQRNNKKSCPEGKTCLECKTERLFAEIKIKTVKRWETIKSDEKLFNVFKDFETVCSHLNCSMCRFDRCDYHNLLITRPLICLHTYLMEEIEVEE